MKKHKYGLGIECVKQNLKVINELSTYGDSLEGIYNKLVFNGVYIALQTFYAYLPLVRLNKPKSLVTHKKFLETMSLIDKLKKRNFSKMDIYYVAYESGVKVSYTTFDKYLYATAGVKMDGLTES